MREAERVTPRLAEIVTVLFDVTVLVVTVKVAVVEPAVTVTFEGTVATAVLLLVKLTPAPPAGAGPLRVTVPMEGVPPWTIVGLRDRALMLGVLTVNEAKRLRLP
jgi:hypothetical protein